MNFGKGNNDKALGYVAASTVGRVSPLQQSFANATTAPQENIGPISMMSDLGKQAVRTNVDPLSVTGNAATNVQNAQTVKTTADDVKQGMADFKENLGQLQGALQEGIVEAVGPNIEDQKTAYNTFGPGAGSGGASVMADIGAGLVGAPPVMTGAMTVNDLISQATGGQKLSPKAEVELAAKIQDLFVPKRDSVNGDIVAPPRIPTPYASQIEKMRPEQFAQFMKQAFLPAEMHPEFQQMLALDKDLDTLHQNHIEISDDNDFALNTSEKIGLGIEQIDVQDMALEPESVELASAALKDDGWRLQTTSAPSVPAMVLNLLAKVGIEDVQAKLKPPEPANTASFASPAVA